jgi:hypothetical protein
LREIAIRMAIGATAGAVIRMFLRHSGKMLLIGIASHPLPVIRGGLLCACVDGAASRR